MNLSPSGLAILVATLLLTGCSTSPSEPAHATVLEIPLSNQIEQTLHVESGRHRNYYVQLPQDAIAGRTPILLQLSIVRSNIDVTSTEGHWLAVAGACIQSGEPVRAVCIRLTRYEERGILAAQGVRSSLEDGSASVTALASSLAMDKPVAVTLTLNGSTVGFQFENGVVYEQLLDGNPTRLLLGCGSAVCVVKATFAAASRP